MFNVCTRDRPFIRLIIDYNIGGTIEEVVELFRVAADNHVTQAEHLLAVMYEYGHGVYQNFAKAAEYYKRASEKHYSESVYHLALMHAYGRGYPQDFRQAISLFEKAAMDMHAPSMYYMVSLATTVHDALQSLFRVENY